MTVYLIVCIISIILALLNRTNKKLKGLEYAFILLTIVFAIRFDFGNDYASYLHEYQRYNLNSLGSLSFGTLSGEKEYEEGWVLLNILCKPIGFFGMIILLTVFENWTIYRFIKKYVPREWQWFAVFIFVFNHTFLLVGLSMMRQWLAMCIFINAIQFIDTKKPLPYFALIILASFIHKSAWILLPCYFLVMLNDKRKPRLFVAIYCVLLLVSLLSPLFISDMALNILQNAQFESFEKYLGATKSQLNLFGIIAAYIIPASTVLAFDRYSKEERTLVYLVLIALLLRPLMQISPMSSRLSYYFNIIIIAIYPLFCSYYKKKNLIIIVLFALFVSYDFFHQTMGFFSDAVWADSYAEYHTIFEVPWQ